MGNLDKLEKKFRKQLKKQVVYDGLRPVNPPYCYAKRQTHARRPVMDERELEGAVKRVVECATCDFEQSCYHSTKIDQDDQILMHLRIINEKLTDYIKGK